MSFLLYPLVVVTLAVGVGLAVSRLGLAVLKVQRTLGATRLEQDEGTDVAVEVSSSMVLPWLYWEDRISGVMVEEACALDAVWPGAPRTLTYRFQPGRRGLYRVGPTVAEVTDPFGIFRRYVAVGGADFVTVLPRRVPLGVQLPAQSPVHEVPRRRSLFEDPTRIAGVRAWRRGDGARRIHWRATARAGELLSRVYEPAVLGGALIALETREGLDFGATVAASLAEHVLSGGRRVGLLANGRDAAEQWADFPDRAFRALDEVEAALKGRKVAPAPYEVPVGRGVQQRELMLSALARLEPDEAAPTLPALLMHQLPRLPRNLLLLVVTPVVDDELARTLGAMSRSGIETSILWTGEGKLPALRVPIRRVRNEDELARLGAGPL